MSNKKTIQRILKNVRSADTKVAKKRPLVKLDTLAQLQQIYESKQWDLHVDIPTSSFNCFRKTMELLEEDEKELLLDLTKRFIHWPQSSYTTKIIEPLKRLKKHYGDRKLYFARCITCKEDLTKNKSSDQVLYLFKGSTLKNFIDLGEYATIKTVGKNLIQELNSDSAALILVDDFLGTGETAQAAITYMFNNNPKVVVREENIAFLFLVSMEQGVERLKELGYTIYTNTICKKGISEFYIGDTRDKNIEIMQRIEKKLENLHDDFKFGYKQSEGLVCMERCPNNTFPIYWLKKKYAPYER